MADPIFDLNPGAAEEVHYFFMETSFKAQLADHQHFHQPIQVTVPLPKFTNLSARSF